MEVHHQEIGNSLHIMAFECFGSLDIVLTLLAPFRGESWSRFVNKMWSQNSLVKMAVLNKKSKMRWVGSFSGLNHYDVQSGPVT